VIAYPGTFPCVSRIEGHSATAFAGLVRTPMEAGNTRQRRSHRVLPHQVSLVFVIAQEFYADWLAWVNAHAFDEWVSLKLPGFLASRAGTDTALVPVRFVSDIQTELIPVSRLWYWRVRVTAEWLPTFGDLKPSPFGPWVVADVATQPQTWPAPSRRFDFTGDFFDAAITFTRASIGTYYDAAGVLRTAAANTPRLDHDPATGAALGLLVEEARTNGIPNSSAIGGVAGSPGTLPTGWMVNEYAGVSGLTRTLAYGVEDGIPYVDVTLAGTPAAGSSWQIGFSGYTDTPAAPGQWWVHSLFATLKAGSNANVYNLLLYLQHLTSAIGVVSSEGVGITIAAGALKAARRLITLAAAVPATTAYEFASIGFNVLAGQPVNFTWRFALPQLEQGRFASSPIPTTNAALARAVDLAVVSGANFSSWWRADEGSLAAVARSGDSTPTGTANPMASVQLADDTQGRLRLTRSTATARLVVWKGGAQALPTLDIGPMPTDVQSTVTYAYRANDYAGQVDANAIVTSKVLPVPSVDRVYLGSNGTTQSLGGWLKSLTYYPARLPLEGDTGGTPPDWLVAGAPASPSDGLVASGTPTLPSAIAG
jgi:hypothetical protein